MDSLVEHGQLNNVALLKLSGELDDVAAERLEQQIFEKALASGGRVVVDLSEVRYVQSPALGILLKMSRSMSRLGGGLALACADSNLTRLCHVTGLDLGFNMFDDVDSAVAFLTQREAS